MQSIISAPIAAGARKKPAARRPRRPERSAKKRNASAAAPAARPLFIEKSTDMSAAESSISDDSFITPTTAQDTALSHCAAKSGRKNPANPRLTAIPEPNTNSGE